MAMVSSPIVPLTTAIATIVAIVVSPPAFIRALPVIPVSFIAAVANKTLVGMTPVTSVAAAVEVIPQVRPWLVDHYFVTVVQIIIAVAAR
jgi:hypothetical protein